MQVFKNCFEQIEKKKLKTEPSKNNSCLSICRVFIYDSNLNYMKMIAEEVVITNHFFLSFKEIFSFQAPSISIR